MRQIDADKLKDALLESNSYHANNSREESLLSRVVRIVDEQPTVNEWRSVKDKLPDELEPVNIVWVNHAPPPYYLSIKDKQFVGTGYYYNEKWWWYSAVCEDYLSEFGESEADIVEDEIEITHWMPIYEPLPEPPKEKK